MAYNPYLAYPYQPQNFFQQQQPQQQPSGILWVSSELEAQSYPVAPNNAVALWDSTKPAVYLKQADASGKPTMRVYTLAERSESANIRQDAQECNYTDFAKKSDLEAISAALAAVKSDIKAIKKELKKKEVEEDDDE